MTFWEHLDELRSTLLRIIIAAFIGMLVAFFLKEPLFQVVLAPSHSTFVTYRFLDKIARGSAFYMELINVELAQQFMIHLKISFWVGLFLVLPYILYSLMQYLAPALYAHEAARLRQAFLFGFLMFLIGIAVNYLVIFPFTLRFLSSYQVSADVSNHITITSYISTLLMLSLCMGVVFEMPVVCWILAKMGLLQSKAMKRYRKHAVVAILCIAAVITPSGDAFTLCVVSLPIYLLYEFSIIIVSHAVISVQTD